MKVLVTGAEGFAGKHLVDFLIKKGYRVTGSVLPGFAGSFKRRANLRIVECDITDFRSVSRIVKKALPDKIFHLAGMSSVAKSWQSPSKFFDVNAKGALNILEAARISKPDARIVLVTSAEIYGVKGGKERKIDEGCDLIPSSPYGLSKVCADLLAKQYFVNYGLDVVILRPFSHVGPGQSPDFAISSFACQIARIEKKKSPSVIYTGRLKVKRDFTDVRDMVRAYWLASEYCRTGDMYNISSDRVYELRQLIKYLLRLSSCKIRIKEIPSRKRRAEIDRFCGNSNKFRKITGWSPEIDIKKTLRDVLDDWRKKYGLDSRNREVVRN